MASDQPVSNTASGLPRCPDYVAHPQSVWFNEHWRPILDARDEEVKRLNEYTIPGYEQIVAELKAENKRLREALEEIKGKHGFCIFGTPDLEPEPEQAFRQGSHFAFNECAEMAALALKDTSGR